MLDNRKLFKTKLCILYQRGRCNRFNCNFAHGDAELRRFSGGSSSFNGRRDYRSGDFRDRLDRTYSPNRRYSPGRDTRNHRSLHPQKPLSHDRGSSRSRSPVRRSERGYRRKQHVDGESDNSESQRISDGADDQRKEDKVSKHEKTYDFNEQLKQLQSEIERLEDDRSQLQNFLEEKTAEEHKLSIRIEDLEVQLSKEEEDCKRITSKIKKFVRSYQRYLKAQEELKRSQVRLQRLSDLLGSDISKPGTNEDDSSINVASVEELNRDIRKSPVNDELKIDSLSAKKRSYVSSATDEQPRGDLVLGSSQKRGRFSDYQTRTEMTKTEGPVNQSENNNKETDSKKMVQNKKDADNSVSDDFRHKRVKTNNNKNATLNKVKASAIGRAMPSTSIAAHAIDDLIEAIDTQDRSDALEGIAAYENGVVDSKANSSYMPPPPPPTIDLNVYKQYEGDDEDVDVEKVDSEMLDIDLNGMVEIE